MTLVDNEGFKFVCPFTGTLYDKLHILVINYSNTILTSADKTWKINWSKSTICFIWSQKSSYSSRYLDLYVLFSQIKNYSMKYVLTLMVFKLSILFLFQLTFWLQYHILYHLYCCFLSQIISQKERLFVTGAWLEC